MTKTLVRETGSGHSPVRHRTLRRRYRLLGGIVGAVAAGAGPVALATAPAVAAQAPSRAPVAMTIIVEKSKTWGPVLATAGNWTVYRLVGDSKDKSTCFHACLKAWPAVLLDKGQAEPIGDAVQHLGFIVRPDGARQVTYEGIPLYFFIKDKKAWEITGNIKDKWGQWWVLNPSNPLSTPKQAGGGGGTTTTIPGGVAY